MRYLISAMVAVATQTPPPTTGTSQEASDPPTSPCPQNAHRLHDREGATVPAHPGVQALLDHRRLLPCHVWRPRQVQAPCRATPWAASSCLARPTAMLSAARKGDPMTDIPAALPQMIGALQVTDLSGRA